MIAVLIVDIWKTTPFMALLILAGLQMIPRDIYEAARIDGVHPLKVFWRVTLPLVRPALMVAVIFRVLDALRIFDLIYVLTPNIDADQDHVGARPQNLFDFDKFAYGSAASTLLFLIIAMMTVLYIWLGRVNSARASDEPGPLPNAACSTCAVVVDRRGLGLPVLLRDPDQLQDRNRRCSRSTTGRIRSRWSNYVDVFDHGPLPAQPAELADRRRRRSCCSRCSSASPPPTRWRGCSFRGRTLLLLTILSVSMFPQVAVLAGLFEVIRFFDLYNTPVALIFSYMIFTLPFTVWVLTTFMRDLPIEIEEAAIVDGATPWVIITKVFMPLMWPALVTTGLLAFIAAWNEFLFALTFTSSNNDAHRAGRDRAALAAPASTRSPGATSWRPR